MKQFEINDTIVRLGETAKENWSLIDEADDQYIWMHLNSFPSGHIIIEGSDLDNEILNEAAILCKQNTKYRNIPNLKICYTTVSNLIKGDKLGSVYFKSNRKVKTIKL
tara:strand:- start:6086 stop:6409 length:324 start_codon:yes stop_codon:yes gene_type:complete